MVSESWLLNLLPQGIDVHFERPCECGSHTISVHNRYELQIEVSTHCERWSNWSVRFRLFYRRADWCAYGEKYIGVSSGIGKRTIKEAIKELIPYIRKVNDENRCFQMPSYFNKRRCFR